MTTFVCKEGEAVLHRLMFTGVGMSRFHSVIEEPGLWKDGRSRAVKLLINHTY